MAWWWVLHAARSVRASACTQHLGAVLPSTTTAGISILANHRTSLLSARQLATSAAAWDVRRNVEGRFARPTASVDASAAAAAAVAAGLPGAESADIPMMHVSPTRRRISAFMRMFIPIAGAATLIYAWTHPDDQPLVPNKLPPQLQYLAAQQQPSEEVLTNWSGTHEAKPNPGQEASRAYKDYQAGYRRFFQPESEADVEVFVAQAHKAKQTLRVVGSGLSPNGLGFSDEGVLSMALMDKILKVDSAKQQVTVQPGVRVQQLADALKPYGLTLQNYASIREQQIGGFIQVSAHGTGARIPSVEEQVVSMRLVTPGLGTLTLSAEKDPDLFKLAKVGLGGLGVITEVTLQCVRTHRLVERTFTTDMATVKKNHTTWLKEHQHLRYLWLPYTDVVVVVQCDTEDSPAGKASLAAASQEPQYDDATRLKPMRDLLLSRLGPSAADHVNGLTHTQLRDELLALDPLNKDWVASINSAEAVCWQRSQGIRTGWSDEILGFDCGGQQWVHEVALPVGTLSSLKGVTRDIQYMEQLLKDIRTQKVPAPVPIEQRWSRGSSADMSPASGPLDSVHSWVGIIMYLPHDTQARQQVTQAFQSYVSMRESRLASKYNTATHWAKLEAPAAGSAEAQALQARLRQRFPVDKYNAYRAELDPHNILANNWLNTLIPPPPAAAKGSAQ